MSAPTHQINIRVSTDEKNRLDKLCEHYALSAASLVRFLLKREGDTILKKPSTHRERKVSA